MKRPLSAVCPTLLFVASCLPSGSLLAQNSLVTLEEKAFKEAVALVEPSVVRIETVGGLDRVGDILANEGPTTGVIVSKDGYIVTSSFNFINKPSSIVVRIGDARPLPAEVVATDKSKMLTLLKVTAKDLTPAVPVPNKDIRVGQWSLALGRTYDNTLPSVSVGIVSALDRIWGRAIQTDAKVSPVNYGGPLVDISGKVQGILVPLSPRGTNEAAGVEWYDGGIGFAIPLADVYIVLDRLKAGEDLKPGLMGISFKGGPLMADAPTIDRVRVNSPADAVGLKPGDIITELDGKPVGRQADVKQGLGKKYAGDTVKLAVRRGDDTFTHDLKLVDELTPYEPGFLGVLPVRESVEAAKPAGLAIRYVYPDSPADKLGLKKRDRLMKVNDVEVTDANSLRSLVSRIAPGESARVVWTTDGKQRNGEIKIAKSPDALPADLSSSPVPPRKGELPEDAPKIGHFSDTIPDGELTYWAYVPDAYNPANKYGLVVWLHPTDDTMEAEVLKKWRVQCQQRGLILLAPRAEDIGRWTPNEVSVVQQLVEYFVEQYAIDSNRICLHTMADSTAMAMQLLAKNPEQYRGLCTVAAPLRGRVPENNPDAPLQFHFVVGKADPLLPRVKASIAGLKKQNFPATIVVVEDLAAEKYPEGQQVEQIGVWVDALDRI